MLPDNYQICVRRLQALMKRLKSKPEMLAEYDKIIQDQLAEGIIEVVPEKGSEVGRIHYIPHKAVVRNDKDTTKMRIVFDASAKGRGPSLNNCLEPGPNLLPELFNVLIRFRFHRVAVVADIEKAFLNIDIAARDRDVLRFLWVKSLEDVNPEIQSLRITRVTFGVNSSVFLLTGTIRSNLKKYEEEDRETVKEIKESLYVDDLTSGAENEEKGLELYRKSKQIFQDAGFNLRKWTSNSKGFIR